MVRRCDCAGRVGVGCRQPLVAPAGPWRQWGAAVPAKEAMFPIANAINNIFSRAGCLHEYTTLVLIDGTTHATIAAYCKGQHRQVFSSYRPNRLTFLSGHAKLSQ